MDKDFRHKDGIFSKVSSEYGQWTQGICYRATMWRYKKCEGKVIRQICNFGIGDLPKARSQGCLIGNKFSSDVDSLAPLCQMKELLTASFL